MNANDYNPKVLVKARDTANLSQQDVASRLKRSRETISRVENGKNASLKILSDLCVLYGTNLHEVIYPIRQEIRP